MTQAPVFLMSYPRPDWGLRGKSNFLSSQATSGPSPRGAMSDWLAVAQAIEDAGGHVLVMPPSPVHNLTGLPYTAEAGEFFRDDQGQPCFLLPRMKPAHRQEEPAYTAGFVAGLGWRAVASEHTWEAQGDAIRLGPGRVVHTWGQGPSARTRPEAAAQVAPLLGGQSMSLRFKADPWFHGNTFLGWFQSPAGDQGALVICPEAVSDEDLARLRAFAPEARLVSISRQESLDYATNALQVGDTVIAPSGVGQTMHALWAALGLQVVTLDLDTLFRRGGGAAVCMSSRLWGLAPEEVPEHARFSVQAPSLRAALERWPEVAP